MSAAAETSSPTTEFSRSGLLLDLVRKLIDYGRELAATIRQHTAADPYFVKARFGTTDLVLILASIFRGLLLAEALEARVLSRAAYLDAGPRPGRARSAARAPAAPAAAKADPSLAALPTPEQIAAEVRRRPIGAVIVDICRDLGITGSHPLWRDVQRALIRHRGSLFRLVMNAIGRPVATAAQSPTTAIPAASQPPTLRSEAPSGTGPP
ncbi:MAG TPA: hypothetical protein VGI78_10955 [Acetobacteraceae bacterium]